MDRASGSGTQTIHTTVSTGDWVLVVVDQDQVPGVSVRADVGATVPALPWVATTALVSGAVLLALAALPIGIAARRASRGGPWEMAESDLSDVRAGDEDVTCSVLPE